MTVDSSENLVRLVRKLRWYRNRLRSMSPLEILHRLEEQRRRRVSGLHLPRRVRRFRGTGLDLPQWPGLVEGVGAIARNASLVQGWADHAAAVQAGQFRFLGIDWPVPTASTASTASGESGFPLPDWHLDPVTGRRWPADEYCFDISYRHADSYGDVKNVWELSRLQYLQPLAAYALVAEDRTVSDLCAAHLTDWIRANPPYDGVHWSSGIEVAFRIVSMLVVLTLAGRNFTADDRALIMASLYQHGWWLSRFPSRHSSANNHLVAEAAGLYLLGTLMPALPGSGEWVSYGRRVLERESMRQILPDGVGAEQSPAYLALTMEWLLLSADLGRRTGNPFSPAMMGRLADGAAFIGWITDADGHQPRIGDDDDSHVLSDGFGVEPTVNSIAAAAAGLTDRPDLAPPVCPTHLRHALLPVPVPARGPDGFRCFRDGGYSVDRRPGDGTQPSQLLVFDHGPTGYLSIAAHGHADTLAIWLHLDGQPVLVDAGTYLYHAGHAWRDHFRGTAAHNTLSLGGENSSEISGPFNWARKAQVQVLEAVDEADSYWSVTAEHDGYWESHGVLHRRQVQRISGSRFRLTDQLHGGGLSARVEIGFLVAPDLAVEPEGSGFVVRRGRVPLLTIRHDGDLSGWVETGRLGPERGWHSPSFGVRQPAPRIVFAGEIPVGSPRIFDLDIHPLTEGGLAPPPPAR